MLLNKIIIGVINMPRQAREHSESGIYHVILRGINRQDIFEEDGDKDRFIKTIKYYKSISKYKIFAYCLMSNHIHLLIKEETEAISLFMQRISVSYVLWYNSKYERCGHFFQERFKSEPIENDNYFFTVLRYIHQNPLKAGLVKKVADWKWSSYNEYFEKGTVTDTDYSLSMFSEDRNKALLQFESFSNEANDDKCLEYEEKYKVTDDEIRSYFIILGIKSMSELQQSEKSIRNDLIKKIKAVKGVTLGQLARITGISKSVIGRI